MSQVRNAGWLPPQLCNVKKVNQTMSLPVFSYLTVQQASRDQPLDRISTLTLLCRCAREKERCYATLHLCAVSLTQAFGNTEGMTHGTGEGSLAGAGKPNPEPWKAVKNIWAMGE